MNIMSSPRYEELRKSIMGDVKVPDMDVDTMFASFGDTKVLKLNYLILQFDLCFLDYFK